MSSDAKPEAYCLTRPEGWVYHSSESHADASLFRDRQIARFRAADLEREQRAADDREAA